LEWKKEQHLGVAAQLVGSVGQSQSSIQELMSSDLATSQGSSPTHPLALQNQILKNNRVVWFTARWN
jgi:hypothetical protein